VIDPAATVADEAEDDGSSRRRRWRRRGQDQKGDEKTGVSNQPTRIPIIDILGDLLGRRKPKPDASKE
jgi:hypothetical protein